MRETVHEYRAFCRALSIIVLNNWPQLQAAEHFCLAVERLIHPTAKNPNPRHTYFHRRFYKFPSYLRRAAIRFVEGQVSSYLSRYGQWLDGQRNRPTAQPPRFNSASGCYPVLYRGQLIKFHDEYRRADIKLWNGREWAWFEVPIRSVRDRHRRGRIMAPQLIVKRDCHLSVPIELDYVRLPESDRVCGVDLGINTLAVASIVGHDGTVADRVFVHPAADIDRRDRRLQRVRSKARRTGRLGPGFCRGLYRKAQHINEDIAQKTSRTIIDLAIAQGVSVIVLEHLKGWRPKGGRRGSTLRQRFHGWLHRRLANLIEEKFIEHGGRVRYVSPRGTSSWAFDGSGRVQRESDNASQALFPSGKRYNADLNASYNIAARYWAHQPTRRKRGRLPGGQNPSGKPRMPATLSTLWSRSSEAPVLCAA